MGKSFMYIIVKINIYIVIYKEIKRENIFYLTRIEELYYEKREIYLLYFSY
jgi:hypothetical protein